ncbi:MAG: phage tail tape measure protein [Lachnospiraceae bacterium]|nr:phage tail tape measure protein [Lachnospiraceae bacterium]
MSDNYALDLLGTLDQSKSKKQINADIKTLEKTINMLRLTATFAKADTKRELNTYIKQLSDQLSTIKLKAKIDNKTLKSEISKALNNVSFKDIDALNIDENKTKLKVQKVVADTRSYIERNPISVGVNIDSKRSKLDNDLTTYLNKYTKITESSVLLEEANKVRDLIDAITDKKSLTEATDAFRLFKSEVSATGYTSKSTADKVKSMLSHITKIGSAFGVASMLANNFVKSLKTLRENDTILTEISKTSEMTKNQLKELGDEAFKIASKYGQLSSNFLLATQEMARAGYDDNVKGMAELSTKAQGAGDMTAELSNQYIIATDKAFKMNGSIETLTATLDGANNITNNNALAMADLAEAMSIVGSQAASSGMEVDETTAAVATMIAVTQRSGSEAANAFKGILMNLRQVSGDVGDGEDIIDADSLTKYEKACAELGVSLSTVKDGVVSLKEPMQIIKELAEAYTQLDEADAKRANLLSAVGGKYRANALNAILENYDMYEKMLKEYADGLGSMDAEAEKTANSWEGRLNSLQNSWDSFINTLTNKEAIMGGVSFLDRLIQGAETLTDTIGEIPVVLTTLNTAMTAMNKDYGITHLVNRDSGKFDIQGNIFGIDFTAIKNQKKHFEEASKAITKWNIELSTGQIDIDDFNEALVKNNAQFKAYLQTTSKDAPASLAGYKSYLNAAGISTDALRIKTILLNSAISLGIGAAIQVAVQGITYLIQREENLRQATEEAANAYKESTSSIDDYASKYQELHKALIAAKGNEEETYNIKKQLLELQTELNDKFGEEYGKINLVTDAYKDQTEAIKALNKETAQTFLNENKKGIDKSVKEMTKDRHYNLSYTGMVSTTDKGSALKEIAEKYKDQGVSILDEGDGGVTFSVHLNADAQSAYDTINAFETDLRNKAIELGDEHMFDDVLDISSGSLNQAKDTIGEYGEIYKQALTAELVADDNKSKVYNEALRAVEAYNDAVLKSENPYDDQNVTQAKANLDTIKDSIQGNEEEWEKYSTLFDDVFSQADTRLIEFNEALKTDDGLKELANDLEGLSDVDLQALDENVGENNSFDKLKEAADGYDVSVSELIDTLVRLGYVQAEIKKTKEITEEPVSLSISQTIDQLNTQLKPAFDSLKSAYQDIFTDDGFTLENVDISMLDSIKSKLDELNSMEGVDINIDYSSFDNLAKVLTDSSSTAEDVQNAFNNFASTILDSVNPAISQCDGESYKLLQTLLESMGIVNAEEVLMAELGYSYEEYANAKEAAANAGIDLNNSIDNVATALQNEGLMATEDAQQIMNYMLAKYAASGATIDVSSTIGQLAEEYDWLAELINQWGLYYSVSQKGYGNTSGSKNLGVGGYTPVQSEEKVKVKVDAKFDGSKINKAAKSAGKSAGKSLKDALKEELSDLDSVISGITGRIDDQISVIKSQKEIALEAIDAEIDALNEQKSALEAQKKALEEERDARIEIIEQQKKQLELAIKAIDKQIKAKEKIIKGIQDEIDAIKDANEQRKLQLNLQKEQYELERLQYQRTILQYSAEKGMHYVTNTKDIRSQKQNVDDAKLEIEIANKQKQIDLIEKEIDLLNEKKDAINEQIDILDEQIDQINEYYDAQIKAINAQIESIDKQIEVLQKQREESEKYYESMIEGLEKSKSKYEELTEIVGKAELSAALKQLGIDEEALLAGSEEEFNKLKNAYMDIVFQLNAGNDDVLNSLRELSGYDGTAPSMLSESSSELDTMNSKLNDSSQSVGNVNSSLGETASATSNVASNVSDLTANLSEVNTLISSEQAAFETLRQTIDRIVEAINQKTQAIQEEQAVTGIATTTEIAYFLLLKEKILEIKESIGEINDTVTTLDRQPVDNLTSAFKSLYDQILLVSTTLGAGMEGQGEGAVSSIKSAIESLNEISLEEGIIAQFTNLKTAIDSVSSAISGGGESSGGEGKGNNSGSSKGGESGGKGESGGGNSLTGAINEMGETAKEVIGEPDAEGDGTVIGEFGSMKTAVNEVTTAIGSGESEGGKSSGGGSEGEGEGNLIGSIVDLGETTQTTLGESGGDGVIGRFEELKQPIQEANEHVHGISDGLAAIDGQEVECTIKVNIETNGSLPAFASGTLGNMNLESGEYTAKYGKAFAEGTGKYKGLPKDEKNALVSEYGQTEMTVLPDGNTIITDEPTMMDLPKGTVIYNEDQTKQIMDNKLDVSGSAHANGTNDEGWFMLPDGHMARPLREGDRAYELQKAFEPFVKRIQSGQEQLITNAMFEGQKQFEKWTNQITNNAAISNIANNKSTVTIGDIHVTCPGVTSQQVAEQLGDVLDKKLNEKFNGLHLQAIQQSMMR